MNFFMLYSLCYDHMVIKKGRPSGRPCCLLPALLQGATVVSQVSEPSARGPTVHLRQIVESTPLSSAIDLLLHLEVSSIVRTVPTSDSVVLVAVQAATLPLTPDLALAVWAVLFNLPHMISAIQTTSW